MARYAMLNCWSDLNKGDLGIMTATIAKIREIDSEAEIIGVSCFDKMDSAYTDAHRMLRDYLDDMLPAVFGVLGICIFGRFRTSLVSKLWATFYENIRFFFAMIMPRSIALKFLKKAEQETMKAIMNCDVCFSKGGSVFTDYNSRRGALALRRICRFYDLLNRFGCKYYIMGQSFGPIDSKKELAHTNRVIAAAEKVYVREDKCKELYPQIDLCRKNVGFSNDFGFLIEPKQVSPSPINDVGRNVGITLRKYGDEKNYIENMVKFIMFLVDEGYCINIFQQVAMDNEPDNLTAAEVIEGLPQHYQDSVIYHKKNYYPEELCWLYGQMDLFVGTRLHSTIFAMRAGTPTIGLVYHGTKAQGIFSNIGVSDFVVDGEISFQVLKEKYEFIIDNKQNCIETICKGVEKARKETMEAIRELVRDANENK